MDAEVLVLVASMLVSAIKTSLGFGFGSGALEFMMMEGMNRLPKMEGLEETVTSSRDLN